MPSCLGPVGKYNATETTRRKATAYVPHNSYQGLPLRTSTLSSTSSTPARATLPVPVPICLVPPTVIKFYLSSRIEHKYANLKESEPVHESGDVFAKLEDHLPRMASSRGRATRTRTGDHDLEL